jgi:hypothetical protein
MRQQLTELTTLMEQASANLIPGQGGDGRSTERTLGINISALDTAAGFDAINVLESWERLWREDYGLAPYGEATSQLADTKPETTLRHITTFLHTWLEKSCTEHPAISEFAYELRIIHKQSQQAAGQTQRAAWRVTCPADGTEGECGNTLLISGEDFDNEITCRKCSTVWPVARLLHVVASSKHAELWLDPQAASEYLNCTPVTLRRWAKEGNIKREKGKYEIHSVIKAIQHTSQKEWLGY